MELNGLKEVLVYYGDICLSIMHSLLTRGVRDYELLPLLQVSNLGGFSLFCFGFFFSFSFFSDEQVFTKDTTVTGTLQLEFSD